MQFARSLSPTLVWYKGNMKSSDSEGRLKIIRSGRVEVKGVGLSHFRFTRQWLCLTEDELLFFKDSTSALSKPSASILISDIISCSPDTLRSNCLRIFLGSKHVHICFKTTPELKLWSTEIETCLQPVLLIGENAPAGTYHADRFSAGSFTQSTQTSHFGKFSHRYSALSGTTLRTDRYSSWSASTAYVLDDYEWPELDDYKLDGEEPEDIHIRVVEEEQPERPCSPVDPELVFELGRAWLAVSGCPVPREIELDIADLTGQICKIDDHAAAIGGFADVWRGKWDIDGSTEIVAIKVIRSFCFDPKTEAKVQTRLNQELNIWKKLKNNYIVPLYGIVHDMGRYTSMISPWMDKGSASRFFKDKDVQSSLPARLKLLYEVASGLEYLHCFSPPVIHGDLKASNILVSESGHALLTDFGISTLIEEATGSDHSASTFAGSVRWMAFELFNAYGEGKEVDEGQSSVQLTTYSDIWSYGSTVLEVLSGRLPYHYRKNDIQVLHEILLGMKPLREELRAAYPSISSGMWIFLQSCWRDDPRSRPSVTCVKETIGHFFRERQRMGIIFEEGIL